MLSSVLTNQTSAVVPLSDTDKFPNTTFQATIIGTGAVSATVTIKGSVDGTNFVTVGSALSLTGTPSDSQLLTTTNAYAYVTATVASILGTGAAVTVALCK